jgi:hypothetical protein
MCVTSYGREVNNGKESWHVGVEIYTGNAFDQNVRQKITDVNDIGKRIDQPRMPVHSPKPKTETVSKKKTKPAIAKSTDKEKQSTAVKKEKKNYSHVHYAKEEMDPADEFIQEEFGHNQLAEEELGINEEPWDPADEEVRNLGHNQLADNPYEPENDQEESKKNH